MAKLFKIETYLIDYQDDFDTAEELENYIEWAINHGMFEHTHITSADIGEWHDEHPLNYMDCPEAEFEKYFKEN